MNLHVTYIYLWFRFILFISHCGLRSPCYIIIIENKYNINNIANLTYNKFCGIHLCCATQYWTLHYIWILNIPSSDTDREHRRKTRQVLLVTIFCYFTVVHHNNADTMYGYDLVLVVCSFKVYLLWSSFVCLFFPVVDSY